MTFQEMLRSDLDNVFYTEELASEHEIDGKKVMAILKEDGYADAKMSYGVMKNTLNPKEKAINKNMLTLRIRDADAHRKFTAGAMITLDKKKMFVADVKHPPGEYVLMLERHMT